MYTQKQKYLIYTCSKCKSVLALETKAMKTFCPHIISYDKCNKPIKCGEILPNQNERDKLEKEQYHIKSLES